MNINLQRKIAIINREKRYAICGLFDKQGNCIKCVLTIQFCQIYPNFSKYLDSKQQPFSKTCLSEKKTKWDSFSAWVKHHVAWRYIIVMLVTMSARRTNFKV